MTFTSPLSEQRHPGEFVLTEANGRLSRDEITIASGSGVIYPGHVLGMITGSGEYKPAMLVASDSDGAQVASAIALYGCDATSSSQTISAITREAEVNGNTLVYHASIDTAAHRAEKIADLASKHIIVRGDIQSPPNTYPDR
jgi:biotin carboxylase